MARKFAKRTELYETCPRNDNGRFNCSGKKLAECAKCKNCKRHCNCELFKKRKAKEEKKEQRGKQGPATRQPLQSRTNRDAIDCASQCHRKMCTKCSRCERHCSCRVSSRLLLNQRQTRNHNVTNEKMVRALEMEAAAAAAAEDDDGESSSIEVVLVDKGMVKIYDDANAIDDADGDEGTIVSYYPISSLSQLYEAFDVSSSRQKNLLGEKNRHDEAVKDLLLSHYNGKRKIADMSNILIDITEKAAQLILPGNPGFLLEQASERLAEKHSGSSTRKQIQAMEKITASVFQVCNEMPHHTMAYRTSRAILASSVSANCLRTVLGSFLGCAPPRLGRKAIKSGKVDRKTIKQGSDPKKCNRSLLRIDETVLKDALQFMLAPTNVGRIGWGDIVKPIPGTTNTVTIPGLTRRKSPAQMHREYVYMNVQKALMNAPRITRSVTTKAATGKLVKMISKSLFLSILNQVTSHSEKKSNSVDYYDDILINETVHTLRKIVQDIVAPARKRELIDLLEIMQNFLKHQYNGHVMRKDDEVCTHGIEYALTQPPHLDDGDPGDDVLELKDCKCDTAICEPCLFVEYLLRELLPAAILECRTEANQESVDDAVKYIADSLIRVHLYQGHRARVCCSEMDHEKLLEEMREEVIQTKKDGTIAIAKIDWAMNYEGERKSASQVHHFGKRGYAWHVISLFYYTWDSVTGKLVGVTVNVDQVMKNDNKKCGMSTLSNLEAFQNKISCEIPHIKCLHAECDNASNYHRKEVLLSIPILNAMSSSVKWCSWGHTETQAGKGPADSHAAVAKRQVDSHLTTRSDGIEYKKVDTPMQLAEAIASNGGIQNTGVQLIEIDRSGRLDKIEEFMRPMAEEAVCYFARCNKVVFDVDADGDAPWANVDLSDPENWPKVEFKVRAWAYAGIGSGARFAVSFGKKSWEYEPGPGEESSQAPESSHRRGNQKSHRRGKYSSSSMDDDGSSTDCDNAQEVTRRVRTQRLQRGRRPAGRTDGGGSTDTSSTKTTQPGRNSRLQGNQRSQQQGNDLSSNVGYDDDTRIDNDASWMAGRVRSQRLRPRHRPANSNDDDSSSNDDEASDSDDNCSSYSDDSTQDKGRRVRSRGRPLSSNDADSSSAYNEASDSDDNSGSDYDSSSKYEKSDDELTDEEEEAVRAFYQGMQAVGSSDTNDSDMDSSSDDDTSWNGEEDESSSDSESIDSDDEEDPIVEMTLGKCCKTLAEPSEDGVYDPNNTFTGVRVAMDQPFGKIRSSDENAKALRRRREGEEGAIAAGGCRSALAIALSMTSEMIHSGEVYIRDAKSGDMEEYKLVSDWSDIPFKSMFREMGHGRRPTREEGMFGPMYSTDETDAVVEGIVLEGMKDSSVKMGPAQVRERLEQLFPGRYCLPGDTELAKKISLFVKRHTEKGTTRKQKREPKVPAEIEERIREMIAKHPGKTGKPIEELVAKSFGRRKPQAYSKKDVANRVNAIRAQLKKKKENEWKRRRIG